jgi:hypothetical protein
MNPYILAALGRERRRALEEDYARGDILGIALRAALARALRGTGEGLFRLGVAIEGDQAVRSLSQVRKSAIGSGLAIK